MSDQLSKNIQYLKGVGEKRAGLFNKLGVDTVGALLSFYPRAYEDWSKTVAISDTIIGENCCIKATVCSPVKEHPIRKGMTLYKCKVTDGSDVLYITIFNNKYAAAILKVGEDYLFFGKMSQNSNNREMSSPMIEPATTGERIRPVYPGTAGLTSKAIETTVKNAIFSTRDLLYDPLPDPIRETHKLCHIRYAIENIHQPKSQDEIEIAKKRLVFEELLLLQLGLLMLRGRNRELTGVKISKNYSKEFIKSMPFELTGAQKRAIEEAISDMKNENPMNRLLQGDVGSGKTAVAAALCHTIIKNGFQAAMMAPTEILAEQHYRSLSKFFKDSEITIKLLTGSTSAADKREIGEQLKSGKIGLLIGTHALIQDKVEFNRLGLVITDEQHRFGVAQRGTLTEKGENPHTYVMSATPIPRTLGLIIYGDLDISILDEMPAGRRPIETYAVGSLYRDRVHNYIKKHIDEGRQGYIVCPLVEEGESDLTAATEYCEKLQKGTFSQYRLALLNGRMKGKDKDDVMRRFAACEIDLLVSTTVIEVGVDVPNAVIMLIENAERFGLSQLHQLRGRVGRGTYKSTCVLISDAQNDEAVRRLKIMSETTDGFKIADEDLKMRGPGDFFGNRQHGLPKLKIANIFDDMAVMKQAGKAARQIIKDDPELTHPDNKGLKDAVSNLFDGQVSN